MTAPLRCPKRPLRTVDVATVDGPERVGVWAESNGLGVTTAIEPACGYSITHLRTGLVTLWFSGLSWREAVTALALLADLVPWTKVRKRIQPGNEYHQPLTEVRCVVKEMVLSQARRRP